MKDIALKYFKAKLSIIPTDTLTKKPLISWKKYQSELPRLTNIKEWFSNGSAIALVCGIVSGGIELIDIDNHQGDAYKIYLKLKDLILGFSVPLFNKLLIERTQRGGFHIVYKYAKPCRNSKLAARWINKEEQDCFIETRGEGGYALISPSKGYNIIQGDYTKLNTLIEEERQFLFDSCISFNKVEKKKIVEKREYNRSINTKELSDKLDGLGLLLNLGWCIDMKQGEVLYLCRPGKEEGISATYNYFKDKLYVFSLNAYPFEHNKTYTNFDIFLILKYKGNFKQAIKELNGK